MLVGGDGLDPVDDNVDIEVELAGDPERWGATVFTLANLDTLMQRWERVKPATRPLWPQSTSQCRSKLFDHRARGPPLMEKLLPSSARLLLGRRRDDRTQLAERGDRNCVERAVPREGRFLRKPKRVVPV